MPQDELNVPVRAVQGEDPGVKMVRMYMAGKDVEGDPRLDRREFPFPPVEQLRGGVRLNQEAAVVQKDGPHYFSFTAVP